MCIGLDKGGMKPLTIIATYLLATSLGPRITLAVTAPILFAGDIYPIIHYRTSINFKAVWQFIPWVIAGLALGAGIGPFIDDRSFKLIIGIIILLMAVIIIAQEFNLIHYTKIQSLPATGGLGIALGFSSIIGNAAGGISSIYFLGQGTDKKAFIGSSSMLFSINNMIKLIIYILYWTIITPTTLLMSLSMIPVIVLGTLLSTLLIKFIPEKIYRFVIIASILYSGTALLLS